MMVSSSPDLSMKSFSLRSFWKTSKRLKTLEHLPRKLQSLEVNTDLKATSFKSVKQMIGMGTQVILTISKIVLEQFQKNMTI